MQCYCATFVLHWDTKEAAENHANGNDHTHTATKTKKQKLYIS